jgi:hypothetical protein
MEITLIVAFVMALAVLAVDPLRTRGDGRERISAWSDDRRLPSWKKKRPPQRRDEHMQTDEMIAILEEIIRDPNTNPTAKCTGIRTLREIQEKAGARDEVDDELERMLYGEPND